MSNHLTDHRIVDYKGFFEETGRHVPRTDLMPDGVACDFWERLYQAFKARMIAETEPGDFL